MGKQTEMMKPQQGEVRLSAMKNFISGWLQKAWLYYTVIILVNAMNAVTPILLVLYSARFMDSIMEPQIAPKEAVSYILIIGLTILYQRISPNLVAIMRAQQKAKVYPWVLNDFTKRLSVIQYSYLEKEDVQAALARIGEDPEEKLFHALDSIMKLVFFIGSNLSIFALLATQEKVLAFITLALAFAYSIYAIISGKQQYETDMEVTQQLRKAQYFEDVLGNRNALYERRLFKFGDYLNRRYCSAYDYARNCQRKAKLRWFLRTNMGGYLSIILSITIIYILLRPVIEGRTTIGLFVSLVTAFMNMANALTWNLPQLVKNATTGVVCLKDYIYIYNIPFEKNDIRESALEGILEFRSLEFRNVSFRYPESEVYVLKNLSFVIDAGHHYAFVGKNGCGKTTITKLLLRLYEPETGCIYLNGKDIRHYKLAEVRKLFGVLFQDFAKYPITLHDNISLSRADTDQDKNALQKVLDDNDIYHIIDKLSNGVETYLGKTRKNATELSGGEWQRLAMARLEYGLASVKILDEPTASLDPVHEQKVFLKFMEMFAKETTITITHRLGATMTCDCIYVIVDGEVLEHGTHDKLMATDKGYYKSMYETQRKWYE